MRQQQCRLAAVELLLQLGRCVQQQIELVAREILRLDVVAALQLSSSSTFPSS